MATQTVLTYADGKVDVPEGVRQELHLENGAQVTLIPATLDVRVIRPGDPIELPEWSWEPNDKWRRLEGILGEAGTMSTAELHASEKVLEQASEERNLGHLLGAQPSARS